MRVLWSKRGVTLVELLVVLMILSLILTAAVKAWDVTLERGRFESTQRKLNKLATVIVGDDNYIVEGQRADFGYVGDMGEVPNTLRDLVEDPYPQVNDTVRGWRGPYVQSTFRESPESYRMDGWGDTLVYGRERYNNPDSLFVRSYAGYGLSDRTKWITRSFRYTRADLLSNEVQGQILDVFGAAPADTLLGRLQVELKYPRLGEYRWYYTLPQSQGQFGFTDIPQGIHTLRVVYIHPYPLPLWADTVYKRVTVHPGVGARDLQIRVNVNFERELLEMTGP